MIRHLFTTILTALITLVGAVTLIFMIVRLTPGDPAVIMLGDRATPELIARVRHDLGLDQPLPVQYINYLSNLLRGDLGQSIKTPQPVIRLISSQLPYTIHLALAGIIIATLLGLAQGLISAAKPNSWVDHLTMVLATIWIATPSFYLALLLLLVFAAWLRWLPMLGAGSLSDPSDLLSHLALPAFAIGARQAALIARLTRSGMLEVLSQDYVRTARAKGLHEPAVLYRHALRNVLVPVVTVIGTQLAILLGGAVIIETVFGRPGIGRLLVDGIATRDYPLVQGTILTFTLMIVLISLAVDLSYGIIDPRVRTERG